MFGLDLGFSKTKSKSTSDLNKDVTGTQTGNTQTTGTQSGTSNTTSSQSNVASGTSTSAQTGSQATTGTQAGTVTSKSSTLDAATTSGIQSAIANLLGGLGADKAGINAGIAEMGKFDPVAFVKGITDAASSSMESSVDENLNTLFSATGGTENTNSMAALLANRVRGQAASNLAGIRSDAEGKAADIVRSNFAAGQGAMANFESLLPALSSILKGANVVTDESSVMQTLQNVLSQGGTTTSTQEQSNQQAASNTTTLESLLQNVLQNLTSTEHTTALEKTKGSGLTIGGKASASIGGN